MRKKRSIFIFVGVLSFFLTGCWNYVGLNEMTVVAGIAIDKLDDKYLINLEVYDLQKNTSDSPVKPALVESTGETIFEAVRNAKRRISNKLYFADAKIIILSEEIAKEEGICSVINWFQKDPEIRENLNVVISQEKKAVSLLKTNGLTNLIVSNEIKKIVEKDQKLTGTTEKSALYKIYGTLNTTGMALTLPAIHLVENDKKKVVELNGIAVFNNDKLLDYLTADETKYYLLAKGKIEGGIIAFQTQLSKSKKESDTIALELKKASASHNYISLNPDQLEVNIKISLDAAIGELMLEKRKLSEADIKLIQTEANQFIEKKVSAILVKMQKTYNSDILGLENILYRKNYKTWNKLKYTFRDKFQHIKMNVQTEVNIVNTGFTK